MNLLFPPGNLLVPIVCVALIAAPSAVAQTPTATPSAQWVRLAGCRLIDNPANDGDSLHVRHQGREFIFRLCYVDSPETRAHKELVDRTSDQARYWKIRKSDLFDLADQATVFSAQQLAAPFTVWTRWEDAKGASRLPRYFAVIESDNGKDLAESLVSAGLARIYGYAPEMPNGQDPDRVRARLESLEEKAKASELGAWGMMKSKRYSKSSEKPKATATPKRSVPTPDRSPPPGKISPDDIPAY